MKGFTLIELMVTIAIFLIMVTITIPIGFRFFGVQNLDDTTSNLLITLRQAQSQSVFQKNDSSYGVKILEDSFVIFQGTTYSNRVTDQDFAIYFADNINISGFNEIVFTQKTGNPNVIGNVLIQSPYGERSISIGNGGAIESL